MSMNTAKKALSLGHADRVTREMTADGAASLTKTY